jgi:hypothetical protein
MIAMMYVERLQDNKIIKLLMDNIAITQAEQNNNFKK